MHHHMPPSHGHHHAHVWAAPPRTACGAEKASLSWQTTAVKRSPDCAFMIVVHGDRPPTVKLDHALPRHAAAVADGQGHDIIRFDLVRSADVYWLDRRTLVVNDYQGSDTARALVIRLDIDNSVLVNLKAALTPDLVRRAGVSERDLDHFYAEYRSGGGPRLRVAASFRLPGKTRRDGSQTQVQRCFAYSFDRTGADMRFTGEKC